jgi:predicted nucleotidyltransferase component of viral defense system
VIPKDFITEWRQQAPWVADYQVEQDLVISRAIIELFSRPGISDALAFRGGTALYKLHLHSAARYSEDIDLVQTTSGGIGAVLDEIHAALDPWLGKPKWKQNEGRITITYRFDSEDTPAIRLKLKVEINALERFSVYGLKDQRFEMGSRWFTGSASVRTYELDELLGTKLRALYQRKKGRDLFDLGIALEIGSVSPERIVEAFTRYMDAEHGKVTRAMFEQNFSAKKTDALFTADIAPLLAPGQTWSFDSAFNRVWNELVSKLPGEPWKGA